MCWQWKTVFWIFSENIYEMRNIKPMQGKTMPLCQSMFENSFLTYVLRCAVSLPCVIFAPNSGYIARYAPFLWHKSPTNCDAHLPESNVQTCFSTSFDK